MPDSVPRPEELDGPATSDSPASPDSPDSPAGSDGSDGPAHDVVVPWRRLLAVLSAFSLALVLLSFLLPLLSDHPLTQPNGELRVFVDVLMEGNLPTWWSVTLLAGGALLHLLAWWAFRATGARGAGVWLVLATILLLFSLDDATWLHERLDRWGALLVSPTQFAFVWLVVGLPVAAAAAVVVLMGARHLPRTSRLLVLVGFGAFLGAAVGLELVGGVLLRWVTGGELYRLTYHVEELLELLGAAVAMVAPLTALQVRRQGSVLLVELRTARPRE